jgi:hypothetical protein
MDHVSRAPDCIDHIGADFSTQAANVRFDNVRLGIKMVTPDTFQQHGARYDLVGVPHQVFQQRKFPGLQFKHAPATLHVTLDEVHFEIAEVQNDLFGGGHRSSQQGIGPRQQFRKGERLRQIIVAAGIEPQNPVVKFAQIA